MQFLEIFAAGQPVLCVDPDHATPPTKIGFLFGWPPSLVGGLLALAAALLGLSMALHVSRGPEARKPPARANHPLRAKS